MSWVKLDDGFFLNRKARMAGRDGRELFFAGLCFCAANLTDGLIRSDEVPFLASLAEVKPVTYRKLVEIGLWEEHPEGFVVHDYLTHNPAADKVRTDRQRDRDRKRSTMDSTLESATEGGVDSTRPVPSRPVPVSGEPTVHPVESVEVRQVFEAWISATGRTGQTKLDPKRRRLIKLALGSYPLPDVLEAVQGWRHSPHHRGENDTRTVYNDLGLLLRDSSKIEQFRDLERAGQRKAEPRTHHMGSQPPPRQCAEGLCEGITYVEGPEGMEPCPACRPAEVVAPSSFHGAKAASE